MCKPDIGQTGSRGFSGAIYEFLRDSLQELLEYAEKRSVRIGIEYEPGLLIERCEELLKLIEEMNSSYLGANLDLGHSHVLGEDPETVVNTLSPKIFHIHIEDIKARKHYHLIPGTGDMDFVKLFGILDDHNYEGFATVELYTYPHQPEAAARQALSYLQNHLSRGKEMKFAFSSNAFLRFDLLETIKIISSIGYTGIEIMADIPHAFPSRPDAKQNPRNPNGAERQRSSGFECECVYASGRRRHVSPILDRTGCCFEGKTSRLHLTMS